MTKKDECHDDARDAQRYRLWRLYHDTPFITGAVMTADDYGLFFWPARRGGRIYWEPERNELEATRVDAALDAELQRRARLAIPSPD